MGLKSAVYNQERGYDGACTVYMNHTSDIVVVSWFQILMVGGLQNVGWKNTIPGFNGTYEHGGISTEFHIRRKVH